MTIYCIWDELRAVQKPISDIWRVVPTAAILWCRTYLQHKMFFGSLHCQISSLHRSGTAHTYQEQPPNKAHWSRNLLSTLLGTMVPEIRSLSVSWLRDLQIHQFCWAVKWWWTVCPAWLKTGLQNSLLQLCPITFHTKFHPAELHLQTSR